MYPSAVMPDTVAFAMRFIASGLLSAYFLIQAEEGCVLC